MAASLRHIDPADPRYTRQAGGGQHRFLLFAARWAYPHVVGWPVTCTDCGRDRSDGAIGQPCPGCGSTCRTTHVHVTDSAVATDSVVGLGITYADDRPWQEQWAAVLHWQEELHKAYVGRSDGPSDSNRWQQIPIEFCEDCWHLKDWLQADTAVPAATQRTVETYVNQTTFIRLAGDVANTHKHGCRRQGLPVARVSSVDLRPGKITKATFQIERRIADGTTSWFDGLDVADGAVAEWRTFFSAHGLDTGN